VRVHVLRNPKSGRGRTSSRAEEVLTQLRNEEHEVIDLTGATADASSEALRGSIANKEVEHLVVVGGDGLVHLAVQHVSGTDVVVSLAPSGTGNDFAAALGITERTPLDLTARATPVDLIEVSNAAGERVFVASIAIAGFPASINKRANNISIPLGSQVYAVAAALELPRFRREELEIRVDGSAITTDTAMLAIGNTKLFGGGMLACPDAEPTDSLLHLTSIQRVGRLGILRHLMGRRGGTADRPEVLRRTATQITIETPSIELWGDGEPLLSSPATLTIKPGALRLTSVRAT